MLNKMTGREETDAERRAREEYEKKSDGYKHFDKVIAKIHNSHSNRQHAASAVAVLEILRDASEDVHDDEHGEDAALEEQTRPEPVA